MESARNLPILWSNRAPASLLWLFSFVCFCFFLLFSHFVSHSLSLPFWLAISFSSFLSLPMFLSLSASPLPSITPSIFFSRLSPTWQGSRLYFSIASFFTWMLLTFMCSFCSTYVLQKTLIDASSMKHCCENFKNKFKTGCNSHAIEVQNEQRSYSLMPRALSEPSRGKLFSSRNFSIS